MAEISLSLLIFRHRIKRASDAAWHALCCQEYAKRWWGTFQADDLPKNISDYVGDRKSPFGAIKVSPERFMELNSKLSQVHIENGIISMAGTFESYMADIIGRCVHLKPDLLSSSDVTFKVSELVQPEALSSPLSWIAHEYVRKNIKNKSHSELIKKFGNMIKRDIPRANIDDYEKWHKFVLLRNALVHAAGLVTDDLARIWPSRFPSPKDPIKLQMSDLVAAHKAAYGLADTIDGFALDSVVQKEDADLLARELFVTYGESDPSALSQKITHILGAKFSKGQVEAAIARQRRVGSDPAHEFALRTEWLCRPHEANQ